MSKRTRSRWGWGFEDAAIGAAEAEAAAPGIEPLFGFGPQEPEAAVPFESVQLPEPELEPPGGSLGAICSQSKEERAEHSYGSSYLDTIRAFRGVYEHVPDLVARPQNEQQIEQLLEWAAASNVAVIPYGGGTSVVGGVEPDVPASFN
ncbi:MAG: FAD-binding protein, partial [Solirubrobacteraceae bacterium]|nr:FAD-binding protein [Solirubrobacteraceae bacterium]